MFVLLDYTFSYFLEQETFVSLWLIGVGRGGGIYEKRKWKITQNCYKFNGTQTQVQWKSTEREEIFQRPKFPFRAWCQKIALMKFCEELLQWDFLLGECLRCKLALIGLAASINVSSLGINVSNPSFQHKFPLSLPPVSQIRVGKKSHGWIFIKLNQILFVSLVAQS